MAGTGRVAHHGWPLVSASIAFFLGAGVSRGISASDMRVERQFPKSQCHRPLLGHVLVPSPWRMLTSRCCGETSGLAGWVFSVRQQRREKKGKRSAQDYIVIKERLGESVIGEKCLDLLAVQAFLLGRWLL